MGLVGEGAGEVWLSLGMPTTRRHHQRWSDRHQTDTAVLGTRWYVCGVVWPQLALALASSTTFSYGCCDHRRRHSSTSSNPMSAKLCPRCFTLSTMPGKRFRHKLCFDTDFTKSAWLRPSWPPPKIRLRQILSNRHQTLATLFGMARIAGAVVSAQSEVVRICTPAGGP